MSKRLNFFTLVSNIDDDLVPAEHVPEGLEFQAICSDPWLKGNGFYQVRGLPELGFFFKCDVDSRKYLVHHTKVKLMYRIDYFALKRNYYLTEVNIDDDDQGAKTKSSGYLETQSRPPLSVSFNDGGEKAQGDAILLRPKNVDSSNTRVNWADVEDDQFHDLNQNLLHPSVGNRKDLNMNFLDETFMDSLPKVGPNWVPFSSFAKKYESYLYKEYYLFDFVAMFIDPKTLFNNEFEFKLSFIIEKFQFLNQLVFDPMRPPSLHSDNSGFGPNTRFLCQSLNGELQIAFLKTALFFSVRKLASSAKVKTLKIDSNVKSLFLGNESIKDDFCRKTRMNLKAFSNNLKLLIDEHYVLTYMSDVEDE